MHRLLPAIAAASLLSSCAIVRSSQNEPLDPARVARIVPGRTTASEVVELLGAPSQVVELGERTAYRYDHTLTKGAGLLLLVVILGNADTRSDRLWVFFGANDVVTHVGSTFSAHRPQYSMPWEDIHEAADNEARDLERPGLGAADGKQP